MIYIRDTSITQFYLNWSSVCCLCHGYNILNASNLLSYKRFSTKIVGNVFGFIIYFYVAEREKSISWKIMQKNIKK